MKSRKLRKLRKLGLFGAIGFSGFILFSEGQASSVINARYDGLIVKLKPSLGAGSARSLRFDRVVKEISALKFSARSVQAIGQSLVPGLHEVKLVGPANAEGVLQALKNDPRVEYAEPNYVVQASFGGSKPTPQPTSPPTSTPTPTPTPSVSPSPQPTSPPSGQFPNDPSLKQEWGLASPKDGGSAYGVNAYPLWERNIVGSHNVIVAIVDTGVDYTHPDLRDNVLSKGYNAITGAMDGKDDNGHGTHVAGIIGAEGNNSIGVVGVNFKVSILPSKFLDANGSGTTANGIKAINWAVEQGAKVINCSWGGGDSSQSLKDAVDNAGKRGALVVAAAGNSNVNTDSRPQYPSAFNSSNLISVAATTSTGARASFSNYGKSTVHISAPGDKIFSTYPNNQYKSLSGTSMATPMVSGVAALVLSENPNLSVTELRSRILKCGSSLPDSSFTQTGLLVSAEASVTGKGCR